MDTKVVEIVICIVLLIVSAYAKGLMDISGMDGFGVDNIKNRSDSWRLKYATDEHGWLKPYLKKWYHPRWWTPKFEEKFPFSTTIFVFLTDYWHFTQFIFLNSYALVLSYFIYSTFNNLWAFLIAFLVIKVTYGIGFNLAYERKK